VLFVYRPADIGLFLSDSTIQTGEALRYEAVDISRNNFTTDTRTALYGDIKTEYSKGYAMQDDLPFF